MTSNASFSFGQVLLVPFPFTNQAGGKQRPAVVISSTAYNNARADLILMAITSQVRQPLNFAEALIDDWQAAGLLKISVLKPVITTLEQRLVIKILGHLAPIDNAALRNNLLKIMGDQRPKQSDLG
jgi:mRNA interferase MazF